MLLMMANQRVTKLKVGTFFDDERRAARVLIDGAVGTLVLGFLSVVVALYLSA